MKAEAHPFKGGRRSHFPFVEIPLCLPNPAQVPRRSPFRYPGGKTAFAPLFREWLLAQEPENRRLLVEPFAGGGSVGLEALLTGAARELFLVEVDPEVALVWEVLVGGGAEDLAEAVLRLPVTHEAVENLLRSSPQDPIEGALRTLVRNRVARGGLLAPGSGRMRLGEARRGLLSRWYPRTLAERIRAIGREAHRIAFLRGDGLAVLEAMRQERGISYFVDPPYTATPRSPGHRLYAHAELDHARLFALVAELRGPFLMTHEESPPVRGWAEAWGFQVRPLLTFTAHGREGKELLLGRELGPLGKREPPCAWL